MASKYNQSVKIGFTMKIWHSEMLLQQMIKIVVVNYMYKPIHCNYNNVA